MMAWWTAMLLGGCGGWAPSVRWVEHRIDDSELAGIELRGADGHVVADLDGDGHLDVVSAHEDSSHLRVAFGTGLSDHWISGTLAEGLSVAGVEDVAVADLDGDGRLDVVAAAESGPLTWYAAPADPRRLDAWEPITLAGSEDRGGWIRVSVVDLDGDGQVEVLAANKATDGGVSVWRSASPRAPDTWTEQSIAAVDRPVRADPVDIDGDGDLDVLVGSLAEARLLLVRQEAGGAWALSVIHEGEDPRMDGFAIAVRDLDGDGRLDIVGDSGPRYGGVDVITWLRQPEDPTQPWPALPVGTIRPDHAASLVWVDLDGDGAEELLVGGYSTEPREEEPDPVRRHHASGRIAWFSVPPDPTRPWTRHEVSRRRRGMFDGFTPVDVDDDGLVDLVTTRGNSGPTDGVVWLRQQRAPGGFLGAWLFDSVEVPLPEASGDTAVVP